MNLHIYFSNSWDPFVFESFWVHLWDNWCWRTFLHIVPLGWTSRRVSLMHEAKYESLQLSVHEQLMNCNMSNSVNVSLEDIYWEDSFKTRESQSHIRCHYYFWRSYFQQWMQGLGKVRDCSYLQSQHQIYKVYNIFVFVGDLAILYSYIMPEQGLYCL